jgi:hypothetical protein
VPTSAAIIDSATFVEYVFIVITSVTQFTPLNVIVRVFVSNTYAFVTVKTFVDRLANVIAAPYCLNMNFDVGAVVYLSKEIVAVIVTSNVDSHNKSVPALTGTSNSDPSVLKSLIVYYSVHPVILTVIVFSAKSCVSGVSVNVFVAKLERATAVSYVLYLKLVVGVTLYLVDVISSSMVNSNDD